MATFPTFKPVGERALLVEFGDSISLRTVGILRQVMDALDRIHHPGIRDCIQGYTSLLILYDPLKMDLQELKKLIVGIHLEELPPEQGRLIRVPVCYGGEMGPDLGFVASYNSISPEEVIQLHTSTLFTVFMMGFTPGFSYMGIVPEKIRAPRLESPRLSVPEGSVGIAESQTGIYPSKSPGGWRLIGRTPLKVFDPTKEDPFYLKPGDRVLFVSISEEEFFRIKGDRQVWQ